MDTFSQYRFTDSDSWIQDLIDEGRYFEYENSPELIEWINVDRFNTEINQLFRVYLWNYGQLVSGIKMYTNGVVEEVVDNGSDLPDNIIINGYAMNFVSAGMDLIKFLTSFCNSSSNDFIYSDEFIKNTNKEFDAGLCYAMVAKLRDFAQHGQLIISEYCDTEGRKCIAFDLAQLLDPMFFNLSGAAKNRIKKAYEELSAITDGPVRISFPLTVDSFHVSVCKLYLDFIQNFLAHAEKVASAAQDILDSSEDKLLDNPCDSVITVVAEKLAIKEALGVEEEGNKKEDNKVASNSKENTTNDDDKKEVKADENSEENDKSSAKFNAHILIGEPCKLCAAIEDEIKFAKTHLHDAEEKLDCIYLYENKLYKPCAMMLFSLIDCELYKKAKGESGKKRKAQSSYEAIIFEGNPKRNSVTLAIGAFESYKLLTKQGCDFNRNNEIDINRNFLMHGMRYKPVRKYHCIKLFALLRATCKLMKF